MTLLAAIASDSVLDAAFAWLCKRRRDYPDHADVWDFRRQWPAEKERLQADLLAGRYRFGLLCRVELANGDEVDLWSACDALVLKALAITLPRYLPVSVCCTHVKGHGGAKAAVRRVLANLASNDFVMRTDVKAYYASIDHHLLLDQLANHMRDRVVLNLIGQYLRRTSESGGQFWSYDKGISLGCPLSPLIGAFFLSELDHCMERLGLFYVRFMDDILVLSPTRWKLRHSVKALNQVLDGLQLEKHPDKTFIGKVARGFDFLGYHFGPEGLRVAKATIQNFVERARRLYEQEQDAPDGGALLGAYVRRWVGWARAGLWDPATEIPVAPLAPWRPRHVAVPKARPGRRGPPKIVPR